MHSNQLGFLAATAIVCNRSLIRFYTDKPMDCSISDPVSLKIIYTFSLCLFSKERLNITNDCVSPSKFNFDNASLKNAIDGHQGIAVKLEIFHLM